MIEPQILGGDDQRAEERIVVYDRKWAQQPKTV